MTDIVTIKNWKGGAYCTLIMSRDDNEKNYIKRCFLERRISNGDESRKKLKERINGTKIHDIINFYLFFIFYFLTLTMTKQNAHYWILTVFFGRHEENMEAKISLFFFHYPVVHVDDSHSESSHRNLRREKKTKI